MASLENESKNIHRQSTERLADADLKVENFSHLQEAVTLDVELAQVYAFWRNFENFPAFMKELSSVQVTGENTSHWVVDLPRGPKVEWDAEITHEIPNRVISWQSTSNSYVKQVGSVGFHPATGGRGTVVSLSLLYELTGGAVTELATKLLLEDPKTLILKNLRRMKALLETGEIPTVEGQPSGREEQSEEIKTPTNLH